MSMFHQFSRHCQDTGKGDQYGHINSELSKCTQYGQIQSTISKRNQGSHSEKISPGARQGVT
eukprot:9547477-Prorocentrum_lima.AAC.1